MEIRRIRADEGSQLRQLRLQAMADAPDAFAESLSDEKLQPLAYWDDRARRGAEGYTSVIFFAEEEQHCCGMASGFIFDDLAGWARLAAMWVEPALRRHGIGRALMEAVAQWGAERGVQQLRLWIAETNTAAKALYIGAGFTATDQSQPLPSHPLQREVLMIREL